MTLSVLDDEVLNFGCHVGYSPASAGVQGVAGELFVAVPPGLKYFDPFLHRVGLEQGPGFAVLDARGYGFGVNLDIDNGLVFEDVGYLRRHGRSPA